MATIMQLTQAKVLIPLDGGLDDDEQPERAIYAYPDVIEWLDSALPTLEPLLDEGRQSPIEQMDSLLYDFISGENFGYYKRSHLMTPDQQGIWELKTPDIRVFGWFPSKCIFIAAQIDSAFKCKQHDLYEGHKSMCLHKIKNIDLDVPKLIYGGYANVL